jgi:hypothetical protein
VNFFELVELQKVAGVTADGMLFGNGTCQGERSLKYGV